jgi:hypothetical protein
VWPSEMGQPQLSGSYVNTDEANRTRLDLYFGMLVSGIVVFSALLIGVVLPSPELGSTWGTVALLGLSITVGVLVAFALHRQETGVNYLALGTILFVGLVARLLPSFATGTLFGDTDAVYTYSALTSYYTAGHFHPDRLTPTHAFPGLFNLYHQLYVLSGLGRESIALWLHPFLNSIAVIAIFAVAKRVWGPQVAVLAAAIFALDFVAVRLGGELRQEALALPLYVLVYWTLLPGPLVTLPTRFVRLLLIITIVITHLVTSAHLLVLLATYIAAEAFATILQRKRGYDVTPTAFCNLASFVLALSLILAFVFYLATGARDNLVVTAANLVTSVLKSEFVPTVSSELSYGHYGLVVTLATWLFRVLLVACSIYSIIAFTKNRRPPFFVIAALSGLYSLLAIAATMVPFGLNSFRFYHVLVVSGALVIAVGLATLLISLHKALALTVIFSFVSLHALSTFERYPTYILPGLERLRPVSPIDEIRQDFDVADFWAAQATIFLDDSHCVVGSRHDKLIFRGLGRHRNTFALQEQPVLTNCASIISVESGATKQPQSQKVIYSNGSLLLSD